MNIRFLKQFWLFFIAIVFIACDKSSDDNEINNDPPKIQDKTESIVILHMNDMHADINDFAKIANYVDQTRQNNENVFLLSAGDLFSGDPVVDQYQKKGYPMIHLMNELKFDLSTIGNHEFDYGQKVLNERIEDANFPFVCANIDASKATLKQPEPYKILKTKKGFEIFCLGVIETSTKIGDRYIPSTHPDRVKEIDFPYFSEVIGQYKSHKKENNLCVLLSHLGQGQDVKMARQYGFLDLIVGGHSHSKISKPYIENNALICQAGSRGSYIGQIELMIDKEGKVISKSAKLIDVSKLTTEKESIKNLIKDYNNNPVLDRVLGHNKATLTDKDKLGALMCDAVNWKVKTDMAFQNSGGIRSILYGGDVKVKDVYRIDPFGNQAIVYNLTCSEIRSLLKNSRRGELKVSGINIFYGNNDVIRLQSYDGKLLDETRTYRVGLSSYIASAYTFDHEDKGQNSYITTAQCLMDFIEDKKQIDYSKEQHIFYN